MTPVSHGKPCAGNPHARFEEGASAPEKPRRNALLHTKLGAFVCCIIFLAALVYALWRVWFWLVPAPWAVWLGVGAVVVNLAIAVVWVLRR